MSQDMFIVSAGLKKKIFITIIVGVVLFIAGVLIGDGGGHHGHEAAAEAAHEVTEAVEAHGHEDASHHGGGSFVTRIWSNLWINNVYFTGIALIAVFWIAVQYVAEAGWSTVIKRIPESMGMYLPIGGILMVVFFFLGGHDIFHWTHEGIMDPNSEHYDSIIAGKSGYLNTGFFVARMVIYFALWFGFYMMFRKFSQNEDLQGGTSWHYKSFKFAAGFLVIFAVTSSTAPWDWVLSIDTHWFSTMFGWYVFASWFIAGLSFMTLSTVLLKEAGYLKEVNSSHLHDLGKFVFGFSIFWTYIWFSQFFLIWYSNIPEEAVYFTYRFQEYKGVLFVNLFVNFVIPFLVLMTHESKRQNIILKVATVVILVGHYLDFFLMVMPGTVKENYGFGFVEIGAFLVFGGIFVFMFVNTLSKSKLIAENHPFIEESKHHHY